MREQYLRQGDVFLLVYDVTDTTSFDKIPTFREQILLAKEGTGGGGGSGGGGGAPQTNGSATQCRGDKGISADAGSAAR